MREIVLRRHEAKFSHSRRYGSGIIKRIFFFGASSFEFCDFFFVFVYFFFNYYHPLVYFFLVKKRKKSVIFGVEKKFAEKKKFRLISAGTGKK